MSSRSAMDALLHAKYSAEYKAPPPDQVDVAISAASPAALGVIGGGIANAGIGSIGAGMMLYNPSGNAPAGELANKLLQGEPLAEGVKKLMHTEVPTQLQSAYVPKITKLTKWKFRNKPEVLKVLSKPGLMLAAKSNPFIVAHEVGHATGGRLAQKLMSNRALINFAGGLGGYGLLAHSALTSKPGEEMSATGYAAPIVGSIAPMLQQGEELRATLKARKLLQKAKIKLPGLRRMMAGQQLGYLGGALSKIAPIALGSYGLYRYLKSQKKKQPEDQ